MDRKSTALAILSSIPKNSVIVFDAQARCVAIFGAGHGIEAAFGSPNGELSGLSPEMLVGERADGLRDVVRQTLASGKPREISRRATVAAGSYHFDATLWPLDGAQLVACLVRKVEAIESVGSRSRESEYRFEALAAQSAPFLCEVDAQGLIVYVGPRSAETESAFAKALGQPLRALVSAVEVHPEDQKLVHADLESFLDRREAIAVRRVRTRNTRGVWLESECSAAWYATVGGEPRGLIVGRDVSERRTMSADRGRALQSLAGSLVDAVIELDPSGTILAATKLPASWAGAGESLLGRSFGEFLHPDDVDRATFALGRISHAVGFLPGIFRWRAVSGGWRTVETRAVSYGLDGGANRIVAVGRDVTHEGVDPEHSLDATDARGLESSLERSNLALLAGGVAHDFNNLLTISLGVTDLIAEQLPADSTARPYLAEVVNASRHAAELARQLLAVTKQPSRRFAPIDVNEVISSVQGLLHSGVPRNVRVEFAPCDEPLWIDGDATQLRQLLLNLVTNAGDAIGGARPGLVRVTTANVAPKSEATGVPGATGFAVIEVSDDGPGIDEKSRNRIFEPAFTTKASGRGLGLAVVQSVVRRHGGNISVAASASGGTTFRIELPRVPESVAVDERVFEARLARARDSEVITVLIVDDDVIMLNSSALS